MIRQPEKKKYEDFDEMLRKGRIKLDFCIKSDEIVPAEEIVKRREHAESRRVRHYID